MIEKRSFLCECTNFSFVAGDTVSLEFNWPGPPPRGGQFFMIKPRRTGVFLARAVSVAAWKPRGGSVSRRFARGLPERRYNADRRLNDDRRRGINRRMDNDRRVNSGGTLSFFITRKGRGSRDIADMRPGEVAELSGPLGNYWPLADLPLDHHKRKTSGSVALVSGGVGIAPLLALTQELKRRPFDFYAGFKTGSFGIEGINPKALILATEDGSQGVKGSILDFFNPSGYSEVFACGPEPMLKLVSNACVAYGVQCYISMERQMACGVGACLGCTVKTTRGNLRCCADGPIFYAREVIFENKEP